MMWLSKNRFSFGQFFWLLLSILFLSACNSDKEEQPYLIVSPAELLFDASTPEANEITVVTNGSWTAVATPAQSLKVSADEGHRDAKIRVDVASVGTSTLTIKMGRLTKTVTVIRSDKPGPDPDPDPDPDPNPGGDAVFDKSWAELPAGLEKSGDYYYAYHMTDQNAASGKARNYTVCYSRDLMCPVWVAAPMHPFYAKKNVSRTDAYKNDPSIPFTQAGRWDGYTRGHMLGSAERLVSRKTNEQVFYHSNIAPQLQTYFNTGGGAWNTLEEWVDTQWSNSTDTTYQIIGCYWANKNKKVDATTIPTHYYKVLLRTKGHKNKWVGSCSREELQCVAIMVEHRTYSKAEVPKPNQYESKKMLYSVQKLEEMTGFTFFANVPNAPKDTYSVSDWGGL